MHVFRRIKDICFTPGKFFDYIKNKEGYKEPLLFYSIIYIIIMLYSTVVMLPYYLTLPLGNFMLLFILASIFLGIPFAFAMPFIRSGLAHLGLMILGAKKGFLQTFKSMSYGGIIMLLYGPISSTFQGIFYYITGADMSSPDVDIGYFIFFVVVMLISLAGLIHTLIVETIAVSKLQEMSYARSFFGIIMIPALLFVLMVITIIAVVIVFASFAAA